MTRVKRGVTAHRRHQKMVKAAKGYRGRANSTFRMAKTNVMKAGLHSYNDRRLRKRSFRRLWIARINASCRKLGVSYNRFIEGLSKKAIAIDRKMLAELAAKNPEVFKKIVEEAMK